MYLKEVIDINTYKKEMNNIMSNFSKVEYLLYNYKNIQAQIKNIDIEINEIQKDYTGCSAINYKEKSGQTYKFNSNVENEVVSKEKRINYLNSIRDHKQSQIDKINNALDTLTKRENEIIKMRYFEKITNRRIAEKLDLTEQYISKVNTNIINRFAILIFL